MNKEPISVYIVDDDPMFSAVLGHYLSLNPDLQIKKFISAKDFLHTLHSEKPDIITLDYSMPDINGDKLLVKTKELSPESKVIMISGQQDIKIAIELLKQGADDYLVKDGDTQNRLWVTIRHLRENISLKKEIRALESEVQKKYDFHKAIIGNSPAIKQVFSLMERAVSTNIMVSVTGETGTGKELVAKAIHFNSDRKKLAFVAVNVAAIPRDLLESELFGHEKGAFTGASGRRIGKFEEAHKGTLFLDEIGEMDMNLQAKLLRVLQEQEITRVGSNEVIKINVRLIVATHQNLLEQVKKGKFREDLYYRLLGLPIHIPPLRGRGSDIILIANYLINNFCIENNLPQKTLDVEAKKKLMLYSFPGNIRELKSIVELGCVMSDSVELKAEHLQLNHSGNNDFEATGNHLTLKQFTMQLLQHYLDTNDYDVLKVAKKLDVGKSTIYRMINKKELKLNNNYDEYTNE